MSSCRLGLVLVPAMTLVASGAPAQEIFADGFESGTLCAWTNFAHGFEIPANGADDDCDDEIDEAPAVCDGGLASNSSTAAQYAAAMDLCQTATEESGDWGLLSASLLLADSTGTPSSSSRAIRTAYGSGNPPQAGNAMVVLSSGSAAAVGQTSPGYVAPQGGADTTTSSGFPADWLAANGGTPPNAPGCPSPQGTMAVNPALLELRIRVPTNARSFRVAASFFSAEFPEYVCSPFNDFFVALLDSGFASAPANPGDKNLARFVADDDSVYPVGVNLAFGSTPLFRQCRNGPTGCTSSAVGGNIASCVGETGLTGTGMDVINPAPKFMNDPGYCGVSNLSGGGTGWFVIRGNVVPGEIMKLRLAVWDTSDAWYDSVVLLDAFQWSASVVEPGATVN